MLIDCLRSLRLKDILNRHTFQWRVPASKISLFISCDFGTNSFLMTNAFYSSADFLAASVRMPSFGICVFFAHEKCIFHEFCKVKNFRMRANNSYSLIFWRVWAFRWPNLKQMLFFFKGTGEKIDDLNIV